MIRAAIPDDAAALARLHIESWRAAYAGLVPKDHLDKMDCAKRATRFRNDLTANAEDTYVVEADGEIQGFVTLGACRDDDVNRTQVGEVYGIYLAPQHWRKGLGRTLCNYAERLLLSRGYRECVLWVLDGNAQARHFYEAMGFRLDGASKTLNLGAQLKAVRYRATLNELRAQL